MGARNQWRHCGFIMRLTVVFSMLCFLSATLAAELRKKQHSAKKVLQNGAKAEAQWGIAGESEIQADVKEDTPSAGAPSPAVAPVCSGSTMDHGSSACCDRINNKITEGEQWPESSVHAGFCKHDLPSINAQTWSTPGAHVAPAVLPPMPAEAAGGDTG